MRQTGVEATATVIASPFRLAMLKLNKETHADACGVGQLLHIDSLSCKNILVLDEKLREPVDAKNSILRTEKTKILSRNRILEELNTLFQKFSMNCRLRLGGVCELQNIEEMQDSLKAGDVGFTYVRDHLKHWRS